MVLIPMVTYLWLLGTEYTNLAYPRAIDVTLGEYTYALVTDFYTGVQIILQN